MMRPPQPPWRQRPMAPLLISSMPSMAVDLLSTLSHDGRPRVDPVTSRPCPSMARSAASLYTAIPLRIRSTSHTDVVPQLTTFDRASHRVFGLLHTRHRTLRSRLQAAHSVHRQASSQPLASLPPIRFWYSPGDTQGIISKGEWDEGCKRQVEGPSNQQDSLFCQIMASQTSGHLATHRRWNLSPTHQSSKSESHTP